MRADNICAGYTTSQKSDCSVLHNISFSLHEGERLCIIGPNGCGKTTLLRVLAGTLPYSGTLEVHIQDSSSRQYEKPCERRDLTAKEASRETGFLTQLTSSYFSFTVLETVMMGRYAHQNPGVLTTRTKIDDKIVESTLKACGIENIKHKSIAHLSGGQLQRVFLARTLAQNPATILLDEPTNHLDLFYQLELLNQIDRWITDGVHAAIGVFHDLSLALRFADTVLLLDNGTVAAYGTPKEIFYSEEINSVYKMNVAESMRELLQKW